MLTLVSAMDRARRLYGARPAIIDRERTYTWSEFVDRVGRAATILGDHGIGRGDRFGILSRNTFRNAEMVHAGYWLGAVPVPVNIRLAAPEIRFILDDSECKLLVVEDAMADLAMADELGPWRSRIIHQSAEATAPADAAWPQYEALLAAAIERAGSEPRFPPAVPDEDLVNALAQYLELDPIERQALLEREGVLARCLGLIELLEMKTIVPGSTWKGQSVH